MVLLATLSAMTLLIPLVYSGMESQRFHLRQVRQELQLEVAHRRAESLLDRVVELLVKDGEKNGATDHLNEEWSQPVFFSGGDDETVSARVEDGNRRWNLNTLRNRDGTINHELHRILTRLFAREGLSLELLDRLTDRSPQWDGMMAEEKPPAGTPSPSSAIWQPFHAMEQLLRLPGWNADAVRTLEPFLTARNGCGHDRLNVNTASMKTLELLAPDQNWQRVEAYRKGAPLAQVTQLEGLGIVLAPGMTKLLATNSVCFVAHIHSRVDAVAANLTVWMVRNRSRVTITRMRWDG